MGLSHRRFPLHGVQFHPESFLTEHGFTLVENFLRLGPLRSELATDNRPRAATPFQPVQTGIRVTAQARAC